MRLKTIAIETILAERGLTKRALAETSGVSQQLISAALHRGTCEPRTAGKLAAGLGVPVADIIEAKGSVAV